MAGLSLSLLVVVGLVAWWALRPDTYIAPAPGAEPVRIQPGLAAETLHELETAIKADDPAAARALAPAGDFAQADALGEHAAALLRAAGAH